MSKDVFRTITKRHSTTFYYASLFFPKSIRDDVYVLYAFLRTADDIVDEKGDKKSLLGFKKEIYRSLDGDYISDNTIVRSFSKIFHKYSFDREYLDDFFKALESDFKIPLRIFSQNDLQKYIYGVAGVVGLMMAKIMGLPEPSFFAAKDFGELMQVINIIRDIREDYQNDRVYIPQEDIKYYGLSSIIEYKNKSKSSYENLIRFEVSRVLDRIGKLSKDIENIPLPYRRPIKISRDVYRLIAHKIYKQPLLVWQMRIRVTKPELFFIVLNNLI